MVLQKQSAPSLQEQLEALGLQEPLEARELFRHRTRQFQISQCECQCTLCVTTDSCVRVCSVADAQVPVASGPLDLGRGGWRNLDDAILPSTISPFPPINLHDTIVGRTVFILEMTTTSVHPDVHSQRYRALTRRMPGGMHLCFITVVPIEFVDMDQGVMSQAWLVSRLKVLPDDFDVQIANFMTDYDDVTEFNITGSWNVTQHRFAGAGAADY